MNILVCIKAVPSTGQVQVDGQFKLKRDGAKLQWNIADEAAFEAALQNKTTEDRLTVITMGPEKLQEPLRDLLARGADQAYLVSDPAFAGSDTIATAKTICAAIRYIGSFDLILFGRRSIDGETGQVPGMIAAELENPCITNAESICIEKQAVHADRRLENRNEQLCAPLPACVSICEYTYTLRLPGIMGMRRAKSKTINILNATDLKIRSECTGLSGSLTKVISLDTKFPGLRSGPKTTDTDIGVNSFLDYLREAQK